MGHRSHIYFVVVAISILLVYILYPTDKKRIKKVIENSRQAVIAEDIDRLMDVVSFNYRDSYGGTYLLLKKRVETAFHRYDDFEATADVMGVSIEGTQAEASVRMSVIASDADGSNRGYLIGDAEGARDVKIMLDKSRYVWKVIQVEDIIN